MYSYNSRERKFQDNNNISLTFDLPSTPFLVYINSSPGSSSHVLELQGVPTNGDEVAWSSFVYVELHV